MNSKAVIFFIPVGNFVKDNWVDEDNDDFTAELHCHHSWYNYCYMCDGLVQCTQNISCCLTTSQLGSREILTVKNLLNKAG